MFMISLILILIVICIFWLILREYLYFIIYIILTLLIAYTYYFTCYYIKDKYFITKLGFIKIKIKYDSIKSVENLKDRVKIYLKNLKFDVYPNNKDIFVIKLNSKIDKQKFV